MVMRQLVLLRNAQLMCPMYSHHGHEATGTTLRCLVILPHVHPSWSRGSRYCSEMSSYFAPCTSIMFKRQQEQLWDAQLFYPMYSHHVPEAAGTDCSEMPSYFAPCTAIMVKRQQELLWGTQLFYPMYSYHVPEAAGNDCSEMPCYFAPCTAIMVKRQQALLLRWS